MKGWTTMSLVEVDHQSRIFESEEFRSDEGNLRRIVPSIASSFSGNEAGG